MLREGTHLCTSVKDKSFTQISEGISGLGLSDGEIEALRRQGFVRADTRRSGARYWKLRFRFHDRVVVRYIGKDDATANRIKEDLAELQRQHVTERKMCRLIRQARAVLREGRQVVAPIVARYGFHFHGSLVRKSRLPSERTSI